MPRSKEFAVIGVAIVASLVALGLFLIGSHAPYATPEKSIAALIDAESRADLSAMEGAATPALYRNFIGGFGQAKYQEIRNIYQQAYDLAEPKWQEYREKAQAAALKEHQSIADEIQKFGRDAFSALPTDQRVALTDDRARFNDFVFEQGLKALPANLREKIADSQAFRENRDLVDFTNREGFALLPEEDRNALKSAAALSASVTAERIAFLESIGLPQLTEQQRQTIAGVPSSELSDPQDFMFRHGQNAAQNFLKNASLAPKASLGKCEYYSEDHLGSLFKGSIAECAFSIVVRGGTINTTAELFKQKGEWKIVSLQPMLTGISAAYPPKPVRQETAEEPAASSPAPVEQVTNTQVSVQRVWLPHASWSHVTDSASVAIERNIFFGAIAQIFPGPLSLFLTTMFVALGLILFCIVMTINFRRLRDETFLPEWLEGEVPLEEVKVLHWWSRVWLRLTNKRIIQVRVSWLFSRRKIFGIALDDIHSATWNRYVNWLLILVGIWLFRYTNPIALLVLMWGLESRILNIQFNAPLARMPFPRVRATLTSFRRRQFNELAVFYKKAQLYLAQVRTQKQLPVPRDIRFMPEEDKDFSWGRPVWLLIAAWMIITLGQRTLGSHVTLEGLWGGVLLGLPVAAAAKSLRNGVWSGLLGAAALTAVKFPGSIGLLFLDKSGDGGSPNLWQYAVLVAGAVVVALVAYGLSQVQKLAAFVAPLLWLLFIAMMRPAAVGEVSTYVTCFVAIASAAVFSLLVDSVAGQAGPPVGTPESVTESVTA